MRVMFDTNVILDLLLDRKPFVDDARVLIGKVEKGELSGLLCATTITTIHYLVSKSKDKTESQKIIQALLNMFEVANVSRAVLQDALDADDEDYEDAILYKSAYHSGADMIVTRDRTGFSKSETTVMNPKEFLALLQVMS